MNRERTELEKVIINICVKNNLKLYEFCAKVGISPQQLNLIYKKKRNPPTDLCSRIYRNFELTDDEMTKLLWGFCECLSFVKIETKDLSQSKKELVWLLSQKLYELDEKQIHEMKKIVIVGNRN